MAKATTIVATMGSNIAGMRRAGDAFVRDAGEDNLKRLADQEAAFAAKPRRADKVIMNPEYRKVLKDVEDLFGHFRQNTANRSRSGNSGTSKSTRRCARSQALSSRQ